MFYYLGKISKAWLATYFDLSHAQLSNPKAASHALKISLQFFWSWRLKKNIFRKLITCSWLDCHRLRNPSSNFFWICSHGLHCFDTRNISIFFPILQVLQTCLESLYISPAVTYFYWWNAHLSQHIYVIIQKPQKIYEIEPCAYMLQHHVWHQNLCWMHLLSSLVW